MTKPESIELEDNIRKLINAGFSYKEISFKLNISYNNLCGFCFRHGIKKNKVQESPEINNIIANNTLINASKILKWTSSKIINYRKTYGIKHITQNEKHKQIIHDYQDGMKQIDIAKKNKCTKQYVSQMVKEFLERKGD